ncbi:MAG: hypothetical protein IPJ19_18505 [Planctomycetes bacterium]|nr:hypothetical protein [Planctomycetota bacterium]
MIMSDVLFWTLIILGTLVVLVAYWIGAYALFPARVEKCRASYTARPIASTLLGLVILVPALLLGIGLAKAIPHPIVNIPMIGMLLVLGLLCLIGSAGLALRIGSGMLSPLDESQPWRKLLRGGVVLGLAFVMPFLGWFVLLPWVLASGLGAFVLARRTQVPR